MKKIMLLISLIEWLKNIYSIYLLLLSLDSKYLNKNMRSIKVFTGVRDGWA